MTPEIKHGSWRSSLSSMAQVPLESRRLSLRAHVSDCLKVYLNYHYEEVVVYQHGSFFFPHIPRMDFFLLHTPYMNIPGAHLNANQTGNYTNP